jgi:chemotaxis protein MotA
LQFVMDGIDQNILRMTLMKELGQTIERHEVGQRIFKSIGEVAPAMGMIGTLIGLVQMMSSLSDPTQIGPAMALTLLTTLYGAVIANVVALPLADKLLLRSQQERTAKLLLCDGIIAIQSGMHPRLIEDFLKTYLSETERKEIKEIKIKSF